MIKFIIIIPIVYILLLSLMKAAGKNRPIMPDIKGNEDKVNEEK
ncbi:hypothetical protein [Clostridium lacusfryxellense]|nr:hypothetical protein [Clostridium lacusfryxellense]